MPHARAEKGDAEAQYRVGRLYYYGRGVAPDDASRRAVGGRPADSGLVVGSVLTSIDGMAVVGATQASRCGPAGRRSAVRGF